MGTASRVLNGSPHVSEATRGRVLDAITQLNYRQTRGGSLRPKARRQVGLLLPFIEQPATCQRLRALVRRLHPHGFDVVVMDVDSPLRARERIYELARDPQHVWDVLEDGARRARAIAAQTIAEVKEAVGLP